MWIFHPSKLHQRKYVETMWIFRPAKSHRKSKRKWRGNSSKFGLRRIDVTSKSNWHGFDVVCPLGDKFERLTDVIRNQSGDAADGVLDYFEDTYMGRLTRNAPRTTPNFPIQIWSKFHRTHEELPRTNNYVEGWHRNVRIIFMCYHPTFWKSIILLKKEQTLNRVDMVQAEVGHPPPAQWRRYVDCN